MPPKKRTSRPPLSHEEKELRNKTTRDNYRKRTAKRIKLLAEGDEQAIKDNEARKKKRAQQQKEYMARLRAAADGGGKRSQKLLDKRRQTAENVTQEQQHLGELIKSQTQQKNPILI